MKKQAGSLSTSPPLRVLVQALVLLSLAALAAGARPAAAAPAPVQIRDVLGVSHVAGKYHFTDEDYLNEGADRILELGSRVIKVWITPDPAKNYPFNSLWEPTPTDVLEVVQQPYYQELFAKHFKVFFLEMVAAPEVSFIDGMSEEEIERERLQAYTVAQHLLTAYAGTGKTFVLQNWEGDHLLRQGLLGSANPDAVRVQGMIDWFNARQAGVEQARKEVAQQDVWVWHAVEANHLANAMKGRVTVTNDVVPFTRADLYSYSSWDIGFKPKTLLKALDHLARKAPDSKAFGAQNVYLGEFGASLEHAGGSEANQRKIVKNLAEAALGWGVRWAVYWQIYCNEAKRIYYGQPRNRHMRGFWLVRADGTKTHMWDDFRAMIVSSAQQVSLRSSTGQYVAPEEIPDEIFQEESGREVAVRADRWTRGPGETFTLWDWNGGSLEEGDLVSLMAPDGAYLATEPGQGGRLLAVDPREAEPEMFSLRRLDGAVALQTAEGWYLGAGIGGDGEIRALRWEAGPAERFELVAE